MTDQKLFVKQPQLRWVLGKNTRKNEYKKNDRGRRRTREGEGGKKKYKGGERERIGRGEGTETRDNASLENSQPLEHRWGREEGWGGKRKK